MSFLIISLCLSIFRAVVLSCNPGEYEINGVCCPMCSAGNVVRSHCTAIFSGTTCVPCIEGTYMDHPNGLNKCFRCKDCDDGAGLVEKTKCTYTSDRVCTCKAGYFCTASEDSECDMCQQHRVCEPGEYVKAAGTTRSDTVCEACPPGHFSKDTATNCTPWAKCIYGYSAEGTSVSDVVCRRRHDITIIILVVFFIIVIPLGVLWNKLIPVNKKQPVAETTNSLTKPTQETHVA